MTTICKDQPGWPMDDLLEFMDAILDAPPPSLGPNENIFPETTPVLGFGRFDKAKTATLGINPSSSEFFIARRNTLTLRVGSRRRLANSSSLGSKHVGHSGPYDPSQKRQILHDCLNYFEVNPYKGWFDPLDKLLQTTTGCSYYDGTACHVDLFPWSTTPVWNGLSTKSKSDLIEAGRAYLSALLKRQKYSILFVNGRTAINAIQTNFNSPLQQNNSGKTPAKGTPIEFFEGTLFGSTAIGWSVNIQSSRENRASLVECIGNYVSTIPSVQQLRSSL
jgi:hypothetical protein